MRQVQKGFLWRGLMIRYSFLQDLSGSLPFVVEQRFVGNFVFVDVTLLVPNSYT